MRIGASWLLVLSLVGCNAILGIQDKSVAGDSGTVDVAPATAGTDSGVDGEGIDGEAAPVGVDAGIDATNPGRGAVDAGLDQKTPDRSIPSDAPAPFDSILPETNETGPIDLDASPGPGPVDTGLDQATPDRTVPLDGPPPFDSTLPETEAESSTPNFVPTGGVLLSDLLGSGLVPVVLPTATDSSGDAGGLDVIVDVDNGEIMLSDGGVLRQPSTGDLTVRDVQQGIAYRQTTTNIAVFTFASLTIPAGTNLVAVGTRAVAIASATTLEVDGVIDVRANSASGEICAGSVAPGGFAGGLGGSNTSGNQMTASAGVGPGAGLVGGGGGGHAGVGGTACNDDAGQSCGAGGSVYDLASLDEGNFHGGSGGAGGLAGGHDANGGSGGAGGGAVRVVAAESIAIGYGAQHGGINASGCGGAPGLFGTASGGGGGAGGAVVIEAPHVQIGPEGGVLAGGGGGAAIEGADPQPGWSPSFELVGDPNVRADPNPVPAIVGTGCSASYATSGPGTGGNLATTAGAAGMPQCGGGGGAGWIRINCQGASPSLDPAALFSPDLASQAMTLGDLAQTQ